MTFKKIAKITTGILVFLTLPTLLLFGFLYFKYNEDLPKGIKGKAADALALKMLESLNYDAYKATNYIEWTFKKRHHYKWSKKDNSCEVYWKNHKVVLNFKEPSKNQAFENEVIILDAEISKKLITKATDYFNNDSFWLVAPYKVFDAGTERRLVILENNRKALLVTYKSGGSTPGDSYLWHFNDDGEPKSFQMWVAILPINGLTASWEDWIVTETGAKLPTFHKLCFLGLEITDIVGRF